MSVNLHKLQYTSSVSKDIYNCMGVTVGIVPILKLPGDEILGYGE